MKRKLIIAALLALFLAFPILAQRTASNPLGAQLNVQDAGTCSTTNSFAWQVLPANAATTTLNLSGTFTATVTVRESNNGGGTWTTATTLSSAGTTTYSTNGFTDFCADVTAFTSGIVQVSISTGLNTGPQGPAGPGGAASGGISGQQDITKNGATAGKTVADGAMTATSSTFSANGSSTSPATPSGATTFNNEVVLSLYSLNAAFTPPGTPTARVNVPVSGGNNEGLWMGDQTVASAGAYAANTGTVSSSSWVAAAIPLIPTTGQTISFTSSASNHASGSSVNVVFTATPGQVMVACIAGFSGGTLPAAGWNVIVAANNGGTQYLTCMAKQAGSSEPGSYTFFGVAGIGVGTFIAAGIVEYSNVAAIDNTLTSATASWTSAIAGQTLCVEGLNSLSVGFLDCAPVNLIQNATTVYPLFTNTQTSSVTAKTVMWGSDSTTGFTGALTVLGSAGGNIYVPPGIFFLNAGQLKLPFNITVNIIGAGAQATVGNGTANAAGGSFIIGLPDGANDPLIGFVSTATGVQVYQSNDLIQGITLRGTKAGTGDCIDVGMEFVTIYKTDIIGCGHDGVGFFLNNNSVYTGFNDIKSNLIEYVNNYALDLGTGTTGSNYLIEQNEMDFNNGGGDILIAGPQQVTIVNNQLQFGGASITVTNTGSVPVTIGPGNWIDGTIQYTVSGGPGPDIFDNFFEITQIINLNGQVGAKVTGNNIFTGTAFANTSTQKNLTMDATNQGSGFTTSFSGTSGTASCVFGLQGGQARATCFLNGYAETGTAQTWTYPFALATTPFLTESGGSCGAQNPSTNATTLTLPANAAMSAETCQIVVEGQTN